MSHVLDGGRTEGAPPKQKRRLALALQEVVNFHPRRILCPMMPAEPSVRDAVFLTRTTLQMDEGSSTASVAEAILALQRVPGVLLAEITSGTTRAIVAHDPAVPAASLLAATERAGARANIVANTRTAAANPGSDLATLGLPARRLLMFAAVLAFLLPRIEAMRPTLAIDHFVLPALMSASVFIVARAMLTRQL